jgi:hypothetical protein
MRNILLTLLLLLTASHAKESYIGMYDTQLRENTISNKYCTENKKGKEFCLEYELTYPTIEKTKNLKMKKLIDEIVNNKIIKFKKLNAKDEVLNLLSDDPELSWSWEDKTKLQLFATTEKTFTLAVVNYNYSGGAHGNYTITYENYDIAKGVELELKDIFVKGFEEKLKRIANRYYRKRNKLKPGESLTKIGWFGDNFILSDNYAITTKGLDFLYNTYEIKPYIAGITTFLLPKEHIEILMKSR